MEMLREGAVLTAPGETYARERGTRRRAQDRLPGRRDLVEDFADGEVDGGYSAGRRRTGLRLTFQGGVPRSLWGRVAAGVALLAIVVVGWVAVQMARGMILRDERFVVPSSSSILTAGNHHLSRAQLLEVFGGDIERNILRLSLDERKAELEQIPWVKHAVVMRLLPDRVSVVVEERTPVAFVRQAGHIGLVDAEGVLLNMGADTSQDTGYSFPVITGISLSDPLSVRAARLKLFLGFTKDLDSGGETISSKLSEVDLSNPEDIKALIPDHGADVLVHFGDSDFLDHYKKYEAHLAEWRSQYPRLSSVDMRYERQVVLEMQPGTAIPVGSVGSGAADERAGAAGRVGARGPVKGASHAPAKGQASHHEVRALSRSGSQSRVVAGHALSHTAGKAGHP